MIDDFTFVLMYYGETSQLICIVDHLSGFYLVHGIEKNFRITCGVIIILTGLLYLYFIGSFLLVLFLYLLFYFCSGVCSIISFQRHQLILCNIEGQTEFSTIAKFSIDCNWRKCLNQHFFRCISLSNTVIYLAILWCHFLCYWLH